MVKRKRKWNWIWKAKCKWKVKNKNEMKWLTKMEKLIKNQNGKIGKIMETFNGIER